MSASITRSAVRKQLSAMGCELFEIGVLYQDARMLLRTGWNVDRIDTALGWLRRENARGAHVFVRPCGGSALSLIDDLSAAAIAEIKEMGFEPALIVETSVQNFQAWLNHGRILADHFVSTQAAKELARRFGGDPSSADWRHFGRLAGFYESKTGAAPRKWPSAVRSIARIQWTRLPRRSALSPRGNRTRSGVAANRSPRRASIAVG
jgi:hypothetical protein